MQCHDHKHNIEEEVNAFLDKLRQAGSRITNQRKVLAKKIIKQKGPFSAEDLHSKVKSDGIDLVTVYRSLTAFKDLELLVTVDFQDGTQRYEYLCSSGEGHHHHIICRECKSVDPIDVCVLEGQQKLLEKLGYTNVSHKLEFFGLCEQCTTA